MTWVLNEPELWGSCFKGDGSNVFLLRFFWLFCLFCLDGRVGINSLKPEWTERDISAECSDNACHHQACLVERAGKGVSRN